MQKKVKALNFNSSDESAIKTFVTSGRNEKADMEKGGRGVCKNLPRPVGRWELQSGFVSAVNRLFNCSFLRFMIFISSCGFTLRTDYYVVSCVVEGWVPCWADVGCGLSLVPFLMVRLPWVGRSLVLIFYHLATELLHMCPGSRPRFPRHTQYSSSVRCYIF